MIAPFRFLWKQLNGPQISAVCQAIFEYFHDTYDSTLEYFRNFSIETANDSHVTLIGVWQGLARPLIPITDEDTFFFTEPYEYTTDPDNPDHTIPDVSTYPDERGFAYAPSSFDGVGGKLQGSTTPGNYRQLPTVLYRALLRANSDSNGELGSLVALDDMLYALWKRTHPSTPPAYAFEWVTPDNHPTYTPGDIFVDLGMTGDWEYPYETQAEVKLLGRTIYYPIPKLIPVIKEGDAALDPLGFIRILVRTEDDVYGLDAMWSGEGTPSDTVDDSENPEWEVSPITSMELSTMWNYPTTWTDEPGPSEDFYALTEDQIEEMW